MIKGFLVNESVVIGKFEWFDWLLLMMLDDFEFEKYFRCVWFVSGIDLFVNLDFRFCFVYFVEVGG